MSRKLTVMKLGGSLLTDKSTPYTVNNKVISAVAQEIKECLDQNLIEDLIIVHGVGSFGHVPVFKHRLHLGFQHPEQLIAMSQTQHEMNEFRLKLTKRFIEHDLPVNLLHASSFCTSEKMEVAESFLQAIKGYVSIGMIPLIGGDMLFDSKMGFSVGSGDQIATLLAKQFSAHQVIFVSDVEGVYTTDPKKNPDAKIISSISVDRLEEIIAQTDNTPIGDVSGAMKGKLKVIKSLSKEIVKGMTVILMSMKQYGNLKSVLSENGTSANYTKFIK